MSEHPVGTVKDVPRLVCGIPLQLEVDEVLWGHIRPEIELYPQLGESLLTCSLRDRGPGEFTGAANPATHIEGPDGFVARYKSADISYGFVDGLLARADVYLTERGGVAGRSLHRLVSIQYADLRQTIGQILHELVVVPAVALHPDLVPVHAGAFSKGGRAILLGGTGGVGKTTLMMRACIEHDGAFLADDIVAVGAHGVAHPNYAFPKVYAYNAEADPSIADLTFSRMGPLDRIQWWSRRRFGPGFARRRISPQILFSGRLSQPTGVAVYAHMMSSPTVATPSIRPIAPETAGRMSAEIMRSEYSVFLNHVAWHEASRLGRNQSPITTVDTLIRRWRDVLTTALAAAECLVIELPKKLDLGAQGRLVDELLSRAGIDRTS